MPSPVRTPTTHISTALTLSIMTSAMSAPAGAQQPSAQTSVAITVRVQPTLAIHGVAAAPARADSAGWLTAASVVSVESNLPYRVTVRLASTLASSPAERASRVFVRGANGAFQQLLPGAPVTVVVSSAPGRRAHELLCRGDRRHAEPSNASDCALAYELSAEYHDTLLRATAVPAPTPTARPPVAGAFTVAASATGR